LFDISYYIIIHLFILQKSISIFYIIPTHKSNDYKLTAVQYYLVEDKTQEEVYKVFKCSPRSLMRWVNQYKKRKPIAYKVKKEYVNELKSNKTITLQELNEKLKDKYKTDISNRILE